MSCSFTVGWVSNVEAFTISHLEECLQSLQNRIDVAYDSTIPLHQVSHHITSQAMSLVNGNAALAKGAGRGRGAADQNIAAKAWKKILAWVPSLKGYVQVGTWKFSCL
ncbi:Uncharacterized protein Rs2_02934 [Raphanus sativus]|nr:Uncharacterized protein Rs2_02934 [Raphanus sativus]